MLKLVRSGTSRVLFFLKPEAAADVSLCTGSSVSQHLSDCKPLGPDSVSYFKVSCCVHTETSVSLNTHLCGSITLNINYYISLKYILALYLISVHSVGFCWCFFLILLFVPTPSVSFVNC